MIQMILMEVPLRATTLEKDWMDRRRGPGEQIWKQNGLHECFK